MKAYILSVCGAVVLSALAVVLLPEGKMGKFIDGMLRILCLAVMVSPLFRFLHDFQFPEKEQTVSDIELDERFLRYFYGERAAREAERVEETLEAEFSVGVRVQIEVNIVGSGYERSKVTVEIENFGMYGDDEHILVISEIGMRTAEMLQMAREDIDVYA